MSDTHTEPTTEGPHSPAATRTDTRIHDMPDSNSAVSWAAILAGAAGAMALSLLLLILGTGLGFSVVSPLSMEGVGVATLGFAAIAWLTFTQLAASGMGGYLAGRLRSRWASANSDEVYFRDTAHGFLTWAISTLVMVVLTTVIAGSLLGSGVRAGAAAVEGAASTAGTVAQTASDSQASGDSGSSGENETIHYFVDSLFRGVSYQESHDAPPIPVDEVTRIFTRALSTGNLPQADRQHIGRLIAQRTNLSQADAERRVENAFEEVQTTLGEMETTVREAAEEAREASAYAALWMTVALLFGAFFASLMAVFGGRQRDT